MLGRAARGCTRAMERGCSNSVCVRVCVCVCARARAGLCVVGGGGTCDIGVPCDGAAKYFSEPLAVSEIGPPIEIPLKSRTHLSGMQTRTSHV